MDAYLRKRTAYQDISGSTDVLAADVTKTLQAVRNSAYTIFIQRIFARVTAGAAGKTWGLQDSAGSPLSLTGAMDASAVASVPIDFGATGVPLGAGKDLKLLISAAGAAGVIAWEGYQRLTSTIAAGGGQD